ncbi:hypothetical protein EDC96DRAFT_498645 [Choanephora cucurbitarum]|nr:hypothetical protein EDC96DRAFT_498645 [Choanephora cucurbitarum]
MVASNQTLSQHNTASDSFSSFLESFGQICSAEQMELCQKLGILTKSEQQHAYRMAKALIEDQQIPVDMEDWHHLTEWVMMLRDRYTMQLESQCIRQHTNDLERIGYLDEVQRLSHLLEEYSHAHEDLTDLLQALKKLTSEWKHRKRDVENIVLSILSSSALKDPDYRVVRVTRSHLNTLGLGLSSIGKYYIVYESLMTDDDRKVILNNVARDFGLVFQENAAQNLARMAGSYHRIFQEEEEVDVMDQIQKLTQQVFVKRPRSVILPYPSSLPTHQSKVPTDVPSTSQSPVSRGSFLERRKSVILMEDENRSEGVENSDLKLPMVFNMSTPLFEPAGWDWPFMLKHKRTRLGDTVSYYWCHPCDNQLSEGQKESAHHAGVWSTSVSRLAEHFAKTGQAYYANMHNNARLMHSHRAQMFEFATHSLMKTYRALQLEQGCANLNRTLTFLYRLQQEHA